MNSATLSPANFLWGAATAACRIEGSPLADGAGPGIWYRFVRTSGTVRDSDSQLRMPRASARHSVDVIAGHGRTSS